MRGFTHRRGALVLLLASLGSAASWADVITLIPSADATLFEVNQENSAGGANFFNSGTTQNRTRNRALLLFDIASALPPGAQITGIDLQLEVVRRPADGLEPAFFGLNRMLRSWGEGNTIPINNPGGLGAPAAPGDATWLHRFAFDNSWAEPGGAPDVDYSSVVSSARFVFGVGTYHFEGSQDMINDAQLWLDQPQANFGWMLLCQNEDLAFTARRFGSREDPNSAPILTIEYLVVPEPGTLALAGVGLGLWIVRTLRRRA